MHVSDEAMKLHDWQSFVPKNGVELRSGVSNCDGHGMSVLHYESLVVDFQCVWC